MKEVKNEVEHSINGKKLVIAMQKEKDMPFLRNIGSYCDIAASKKNRPSPFSMLRITLASSQSYFRVVIRTPHCCERSANIRRPFLRHFFSLSHLIFRSTISRYLLEVFFLFYEYYFFQIIFLLTDHFQHHFEVDHCNQ